MKVFMQGGGIHLVTVFGGKYLWTPPQPSTDIGMSEIQFLIPKSSQHWKSRQDSLHLRHKWMLFCVTCRGCFFGRGAQLSWLDGP